MGERIAVLGAGPMGLAVAYQLAKDGHTPVLFEADSRVGGMTAAFDFSGLTIERFYHFHCTTDLAFLQMVDELGLTKQMHWVPTKMGYWYQNRLQEWGNPLALLKFEGLGWFSKLRYGLHVFLATQRNNWKPLDGLSAVKWLKRWVGKRAYDVLWSRLFDYKFYDFKDDQSAAWIWSRIRRIGGSRSSLGQEQLGYLDGGSDALLRAMTARITAGGGIICLKTPISKVVIEDGQVKGVESLGIFEPFSKVISTIPVPFIPQIMPDLPQDILNAYVAKQSIAVVCVIVKLRRQLTDKFWVNINDPDMDIPGLVEYSNLRPLDDQHVVYVPFYMPGDHVKYLDSDAVFVDKVRRYLKRICPALQDSDFLDIRASRYRHAQPICPPNFLDTLPPVELPIKGLWVADTSYYYPEDRGISESIDFGRTMARNAIRKVDKAT
jgi:protoporphyrinogen oxidase